MASIHETSIATNNIKRNYSSRANSCTSLLASSEVHNRLTRDVDLYSFTLLAKSTTKARNLQQNAYPLLRQFMETMEQRGRPACRHDCTKVCNEEKDIFKKEFCRIERGTAELWNLQKLYDRQTLLCEKNVPDFGSEISCNSTYS